MEAADAELHSLVQRCRRELLCQGYCVVPSMLTSDDLDQLRLEADTLYEVAEEERQRGCISACGSRGSGNSGLRWGADAQSSCIFESIPGHRCTPQLRSDYAAYRAARSRWPLRPGVWRLLFQSWLTKLVLALLGPEAVLFNDQYILKPPEAPLSAFSLHRDSDWCRCADVIYQPYISVWCALDDMTLHNGCFVVQPGSHVVPWDLGTASSGGSAAPRQTEAAAHGDRGSQHLEQQPQQLHQQLRQQDRDQGQQQQQQQQQQRQTAQWLPGALPLQVPAGTAIITSDTVLHGSGPNRSQHMRRAWMPQFSSGPLLRRDGSCVSLAVPLASPTAVAEASCCN